MQVASKTFEGFRRNRRFLVQQYVGKNWSDNGAPKMVPINLISLYVSIIGRLLVARNPRYLLTTFNKESRWVVHAMQSWSTRRVQQIGLKDTMRRLVHDGLFSVMAAKVSLTTPAESVMMGHTIEAATPMVSRVDLDDILWDPHATDPREFSWIGHHFRLPRDAAIDSGLYHRSIKDLAPTEHIPYNIDGDERVEAMSRGSYSDDTTEYEDYLDFWEVYDPRRRLILTLSHDRVMGASPRDVLKPLREQEWIGPDHGPYLVRGFGVVPGSAMPKAPLQDLLDLHLFVNNLYRKIMDQAGRVKEVTLVRSTEEGEALRKASDGEMLRSDDPAGTSSVTSGNPNTILHALYKDAWDLFSRHSGNLDMLGGLSPQSKTATQDKILAANASRTLSDMQEETVDFAADIGKALHWYWWHDPVRSQETVYSPQGLPDIQVQRLIQPQDRHQLRFEDLDIQIAPYSMQYQGPSERIQALTQLMMQVLIPLSPMLQQHGIVPNMSRFLEIMSQYLDLPELGEITEVVEPVEGAGGSHERTLPTQTDRSYTRENVPARTREGNDMMLMNQAMGMQQGGSQNGQMAGAGY